jgi:hypothetical protein
MAPERAPRYIDGDQYVRRGELQAHLEAITSDIDEIKTDGKAVRQRTHELKGSIDGLAKLVAVQTAISADRQDRDDKRFTRWDRIIAGLIAFALVVLQIHPIHF